MDSVIISKGNISAKINFLGAELCSLIKDGKEYIWEGNPNVWSNQAPILFPVCGGLKNDKFIFDGKEYKLCKHGFAKVEMFKLNDKTEDYVSFVLSNNAKTMEQYPFKFDFYANFYIVDNGLKVEYKVVNKDKKSIYFAVGAHEGYAIDNIEDYKLVFEKGEQLKTFEIERGLLSGKSTVDRENVKEIALNYDYFNVDAIILDNVNSKEVSLVNSISNKGVKVCFNDFKHLLIWTKPNAKFVCIEPWSAMPDLIDCNNKIEDKPDITELKVGQSKTYKHEIIFEK